jgi:hypothetical protein
MLSNPKKGLKLRVVRSMEFAVQSGGGWRVKGPRGHIHSGELLAKSPLELKSFHTSQSSHLSLLFL